MTASLEQDADKQALIRLVRDCSVSGVTRRVLLLRTDLLPPRLLQPRTLRQVQDAVEPLQGVDRFQRYELAHGRIGVSWRGEDAGRLAQALDHLERLLLAFPLDAPAMSELARLFDLPQDGAALVAVATSPSALAEPNRPATPPDVAIVRPPLDALTLEAIEVRLAQAHVARFARHRPVCRMATAGFALAWEERFLSVPALMAELAPDHDGMADPFLLRRLSHIMDRRLLALLSASAELDGAGAFSLRLNVGSVLSPEFLRFDHAMPPRLRGHVLIGLQPVDILEDLGSFQFARAFAQARGYRVVLHGLDVTLIGLLDLAALDADFLRVQWSAALSRLDLAALRAGAARWVLTGADGPAALAWGRSAGIGLFEGEAVQGTTGHASRRTAA
jgi:hypothetical protein